MQQCKGCAKKGICRMELMEKTVESRVLFEGKIITVRLDKAELPNGRVASREVVEHPGGGGGSGRAGAGQAGDGLPEKGVPVPLPQGRLPPAAGLCPPGDPSA